MEKLLVLLVTVEQETLIETFYSKQRWTFQNIGPYLSELTVNEISNVIIPQPDTDTTNSNKSNGNVRGETKVTTNKQSSIRQKGNHTATGNERKSRTGFRLKQSQKTLQQQREKDENPENSNVYKITRKIARRSCQIKDEKSEDMDQTNDDPKPEVTLTNDVIETSTADSERTLKYTCSHCNYSTNNNSNYQRHLREVHVKDRHPCSKCDKTFKSKHEAKSHLIYAHVKGLNCEKCGRKFTSRGGLLNHTKQVHQKKVLYKCDICLSSFFYRQHYLGHMNRHAATKPYKCSHCFKSFVYKSSCNIHEKSCQGVKEADDKAVTKTKDSRVLCDICGDELSSKSVLKTHHKMVHMDAPKSKCVECGKSFKGEYSLKRHVNIAHTEAKNLSLPCEICGKSFNQVQVLRQHVKRHKKEFSVNCSTCGKGFYSNYKLKEHERTHTGEKPYSCPVCRTFKCSSKYNLASHLKVHEDGRKPKGKRKKDERPAKVKTKNNEIAEGHSNHQHQGESNFTEIVVHTQNLTNTEEDHIAEKYSSHSNSAIMMNNPYNGLLQSHHDHGQLGHRGVHDSEMNSPISLHYEHNHYQPGVGISANNMTGFEQRIQSDSYYGNTSSAVAQGLNILTVAMNLVDHTPY